MLFKRCRYKYGIKFVRIRKTYSIDSKSSYCKDILKCKLSETCSDIYPLLSELSTTLHYICSGVSEEIDGLVGCTLTYLPSGGI